MKSFGELTSEQQVSAASMAFYDLINMIRDGVLEIELVDPISQKRFVDMMSKSRKEEKPRMLVLRLLHDKPIRKEIERLALAAAHGADYGDDGEAIKEVDHETAKRVVGQS